MWVMRFDVKFGTMIYMNYAKWQLCIKMILALLVVFSPPILFAIFRPELANRLSKILYRSLWIIVFIFYPFLAGLTPLLIGLVPVSMTTEMLLIFGLFLLGIEIFTSPNSAFNLNFHQFNWKRISPEWIVLALILTMSLDMTRKLIQINEATGSFLAIWFQTLTHFAILYIFYRINHYYLINVIYKKKGLIYYVFSFIGLMAIFYLPMACVNFYLPALKTMLTMKTAIDWVGPDAPSYFWAMYAGAITSTFILTIPLAIIIQWLRQGNEIVQLQKENIETELSLLKQQINPHFFFNTLNNVYSMSLTNDVKTSEGILRLSDLMRYVIYRGNDKMVTLKEEIDYINDFLALQQMRFAHNVHISFQNDIADETILIPPLLFITFVENAIKHGVEEAEKSGFIKIFLKQLENKIDFICTNSIEENNYPHIAGMGLDNLQRRLNLLFPEQHTMITEKRNDEYFARLTIDL